MSLVAGTARSRPRAVRLRSAVRALERLSRHRVQEQLRVVAALIVEVEQAVEGARDGVERAGDPRQVPVVLDELQDGALVGELVVDGALPGEGRDDQQR